MYKLYNYLEPFQLAAHDVNTVPSHINFKTGLTIRLHPKRTFVKGELVKVEYFEHYDGETFENLILFENYVYDRDEDGLAIKRTQTITWLWDDNQESEDKKVTEKYYDKKTQIYEIRRRRENTTDWLQGQANNVHIGHLVKPMVNDITNQIQSFINNGGSVLIDAVANYSAAWLDTPTPNFPQYTFRQYIISELTY